MNCKLFYKYYNINVIKNVFLFFSHWFGEDGEPIRLLDPLARLSCCMLTDFSENCGYFDIKYTNVSMILL